MFYVLDNNEKVIGIIQRNIDNKCKNIYFDDLLQEDLISGAEVLTFSAILEKKLMKEVTPSNYIAFKKDNSYKLMQIVEVEDEKTENGIIKNVYCESAGLELINEIYTGGNMESVNFKMFLSNILQDTFWNIGNIDSSLIKNISLKIEQKSIYNLIQEHSKTFGAEIAFRVEIKNNRVVGRYIDAYVKKGKDIGKRLEIKKDIKSITRKINMIDYATKLIGKGKDGLTFKDIEDISLNKPRGQDFLINEMAYSQLNYKGKHITKVFEYDTTDPRELLLQTKKALDEYSKLKIEYQIDSNIIDYTDIEIGDTLYISDLTFEPSLLVSSRVVKLETSNTNPNTNKLTLSNFKEIKSSISKFPIGSNDILDGAITEGKIDNEYLKTIKTDVIIAAKADVEELIADKADIKDLNAINATIDNLKAKDANIENLVANKADIADLDAVNANIDILQSDMAQIDTLLAGNITADNIQAGSITANEIASGTITAGSGIIADGAIGNAQISSVDAGKINAGTIDTSKVTVVGPNSNLKISGNRLQVFTGIGSDQFERVSLGDVNGDGSIYGFRVRGADGQTVLIDENGVKEEGITDGSITNEKISDNANIDGSKLDINSVVRNINKDGTEVIKGTKINVSGTNLETKLSTITQKQTEDTERITQAYSKITANKNKINLKVDNQTYQTDKNNINTTLNRNSSEISLLKDKIALKVEQTDITNAINNIQVGGRNLFINSGMFKSGVLSNWINNGGSGLTVETKEGFSCLKATGSYRRPAITLKTNTDYMYWVEIMFDRDVTVGRSTPLHYWLKSMPSGARKEAYIEIIEGSGIAKANTWHKIVLHIKPTSLNSGDNYLELTPFIYKSPMPETWWIKFIKLEEGNKSTDWSSAPEDISAEILAVDSKTTTINNRVSEITADLNSITQRVSNTETTTTNLTNKFNNLQIGGANLFKQTKEYSGSVWNNNSGTAFDGGEYKGLKVLRFKQQWARRGQSISCEPNTTYTLSAYVKGGSEETSPTKIGFYGNNLNGQGHNFSHNQLAPRDWERIAYTFTTSDTATSMIVRFEPFTDNYQSNRPDMYICGLKLEKGNKPTDWTPAPEDIDTKVTEVKNQVSEITTNINGISSKVETLQQKEIQNRRVGAFRYIKDYLNGSTSNTGNHWVEIQVWANGTNIAQGKTPTTNSARNVHLITDGNTATDPYSDAAGTWAWVQIDLGEIRYDVDMIKVWHYYKDNRAYNNKLMVSMDGQTWHTLFNSEESGKYKENSSGRTYIINESYTETRLKTAEQKITDEAITNTVKQNFYTKGDIDGKGYQTSSQVQQTVNQLQIKFTESGGYNKIRNSKIMETSNGYGFGGRSVDASLMASGNTYTFTVNGRTVNGIGGKYCVIYLYDKDWNWSISISIPETTDTTKSKTFTLPSNILPENLRVSCYHYPNGGDRSGSSRVNWVSITDGTLSHPWSPHPSEIYDGITRIDKDGITVTSSNVKSKTSMTASGFKITKTDTNTDVFKVASDGNLEIQGSIITNSSSGARAELKEDSLRFYNTNNDLAGKMSYLYDPYVPEGNSKEILWVRSASGYALKLESQGANASLEANKVYISAKASDGVIGLNSTKINIDGDLHCGDAIYGQHDLIRLGYHAINFATVGQSKFGYSLKLNNSLIATSENEGNSIHFLCYGSNSMLSAQVYGGGFYARGPISRSLRTINNTTALEEMQNTEVIISDNKRLVIPKRYSRNSKDTSTIGLTKTIDYQTGEENINMDYNTVISTLWQAVLELSEKNDILVKEIEDLKQSLK